MKKAFVNGKVLSAGRIQDGLAVVVDGADTGEVIPAAQLNTSGCELVDLAGQVLLPGFIDVQVNGGGGVLFNDAPTVDSVRRIARAHQPFGTTGMLPTLISDDLDVVHQGLAAVAEAIDSGVAGVLGIHIEGPFLNRERRGIHDAHKIQAMTAEIIDDLTPLKNGCTLLTVAPETLEPGMVQALCDKGFLLSAGHSNAAFGQVKDAIGQGLRGFTHLFNAMSQVTPREPGMVGAALDSESSWAGIIADGHHVSDAALRIAYRCKGPDKLMLITDAMPPVGSAETGFTLMGRSITVKNGVCMDSNGTLAGAALDMASALRNIMRITGCGLDEASQMASASPAAFLGREKELGRIRPGSRADFVVLDSALRVVQTVIRGQQVYPLPTL